MIDATKGAYTLDQYQNAAMSFRLESATALYAVLLLASEAGEVTGKYGKAIRDGAPVTFQQDIKKELGDVLWAIAAIAIDNGFTLEDVALTNILKLSSRKTNGTLQGSGDDR